MTSYENKTQGYDDIEVTQVGLRTVLGEIVDMLVAGHDVLNDLEDRINGSSPRPIESKLTQTSAEQNPGARTVADRARNHADSLIDRLRRLRSSV